MPVPLPPGEHIIYRAKLHWVILLRPAVLAGVGFFCALCTLVTATAKPPPDQPPLPDGLIGSFVACSACILGLALIWTLVRIKAYIDGDFILTNRRVILEQGGLRRQTLDMYLKHIDSLYVERSLLGQILGYGTINIRSQASAPWHFYLADAEEVRRQVQNQIARQS